VRPRERGRALAGPERVPHGSVGSGTIYTWSMPTPVGPVAPDPDDPDSWDWGEDDGDFPRRRQPWRLFVVGIIVLGLVLLLVVSVL
jgi:hypothetical protein